MALIATDAPPEPEQKDITYAEFISEWMLMVQNSNRASSMKEKESTLRLHLIPYFGKMYLQDITRRDIEFCKLQQRQRGFKEKSVNNQLGTLSKSLNDAMDLEYIERAPRITWLKEPAA